jgi:CHAT domain-containing protein/Tfp pilus assembly protein PilF
VLNNLAVLYDEQGAYEKAEPLLERALAIQKRTLGEWDPAVATSLENLGVHYRRQRAFVRAEPLFQSALSIQVKAHGYQHPDTAYALHELAAVFLFEGNFQKAEPMFRQVLAIDQKTLGAENPIVAYHMNSLAELYKAQGNYAEAKPLLETVLTIITKVLGPQHPMTADSLTNLAGVYQDQGEYGKAEPLFMRALAIDEKTRGAEHPNTISTRSNVPFLYAAQGKWDRMLGEVRNINRNTWTLRRLAFGGDTERKQILLEKSSYLSILHTPMAMPVYRTASLSLFLQTSLADKARMSDELRAALDSMKRQAGPQRALIDELEAIWNQMSTLVGEDLFKHPNNAYQLTYSNLRQHEDELIADISAKSEAFRKIITEPEPAAVARQLHEAVLVDIVRIDHWEPKPGFFFDQFRDPLYVASILFPDGRIDAVDLGDAKSIDALVAAYLRAQEVTDNQAALRNLADQLSRKVLDPLIKLVGRRQDWYLSADGSLRLIPFGALLLSNGKYAAEQYRFWSLGSGRDLIGSVTRYSAGSHDVVLANPDYGHGLTTSSFAPLPDTEEEAITIQKFFKDAQIIAEDKRNKKTLLSLDRPPRILHLATHGYFRREGNGDALLRAGIALAGANLGPEGLLTAKEAQGLRLNGTSLVVLSACETGVGEVSFSAGLSGLQRSLALAGARTQLLTLWPVNSARTREFMDGFYRRMAAGKTKGEAWIETQREMIREGLAPHFWAPFVLYGDPGRL